MAQSLALRRLEQPERPPWFQSDVRLKVIENVDFQGIHLGKAISSLSSQTKVPLEVSPHLKDCRVSIVSRDRPLSEILMRIQEQSEEEEAAAIPYGSTPLLTPAPVFATPQPLPVWMTPLEPSPVLAASAAGAGAIDVSDSERDDSGETARPVMTWRRVGILDLVLIYALTWGAVKYWAYLIGNL